MILLQAITKLFLLSAVGYFVVRLRIVSTNAIQTVSRFVILISLPALIITTLAMRLDSSMLGILGVGVLAALALNGGSFLSAFLFRKIFIPRHEEARGLFLSLSAIQNAGYLPIPLVVAVLPEELRSEGLLLIFFYMVVMNPLFWSLGVRLISGGSERNWRENVSQILNPPLIAMVLGLLFLLPPVKSGFTALPFVSDVLTLIGKTTIPLVMVVLGGSFGSGLSLRGAGGRIICMAALVKLVVTPLVALLAAVWFSPSPIFGFVFVLEAAMPAAMNHIVAARHYGGDTPLIARALFVQYAMSVVTVPLFLYLFESLK
jgi:predicted permease